MDPLLNIVLHHLHRVVLKFTAGAPSSTPCAFGVNLPMDIFALIMASNGHTPQVGL